MKLGDLAVDKITGYSGVIEAFAFHLHACTRVGLRSQTLHPETGMPQEIVWVDDTQVEVSRKGVIRAVTPTPFEARMGDKVREAVTGVEGIITSMALWLNGCAKVGIQQREERHEGRPVADFYVPVRSCEILKAGAIPCEQPDFLLAMDPQYEPIPQEAPVKNPKPGGPQKDHRYKDFPS